MGQYTFHCPQCNGAVYISITLTPASLPEIDQLEKDKGGLKFDCPLGHTGVVFTNYNELRTLAQQP